MTAWQIAIGQLMGIRPPIPLWQASIADVADEAPFDDEVELVETVKRKAAPVMRDRVRAYIRRNPGCSFREIADAIISTYPGTPRYAVADAVKQIGCELRKVGDRSYYNYWLIDHG